MIEHQHVYLLYKSTGSFLRIHQLFVHLQALQLRSEMSGFIVRIAAAACLLVFLYSRQSSAADFWNIDVAPVVDLPDDPNDSYYNSESFFTAVEYL